MDNEREVFMVLSNQRGQAVVEYLLLLVVVVMLANTFFRSDAFRDNLGENSSLFEALAKEIEFSYRYGSAYNNSSTYNDFPAASSGHESYFRDASNSRFFGPLVANPPQ